MKFVAVFVATLAAASAFAPIQTSSRQSTELAALFDNISGMNLFDPDNNKYGARDKKQKVKQGKIGSNSYVPAGLTPAQYEAVRAADAKKREESYKKNVSKAFKYLDFNSFYQKRGTEEGGKWLKAPTRGHRMAKTKYDFDNISSNTKKYDGVGSIFGGKK